MNTDLNWSDKANFTIFNINNVNRNYNLIVSNQQSDQGYFGSIDFGKKNKS